MDRDDVIGTLNDLIETSKDGEEGFRTCADAVKNPQLKSFFEQKAERCRLGAAQLQQKVRELGGEPVTLGIVPEVLRRWKHALQAEGEQAFPGHGNLPPAEDELRRLKAEVKRLEAERDILKKATALFAKEPL